MSGEPRFSEWALYSSVDASIPWTPPKSRPPGDLVIISVDRCWMTWYGPDPGETVDRRAEDGERRPVKAVYVRSPIGRRPRQLS